MHTFYLIKRPEGLPGWTASTVWWSDPNTQPNIHYLDGTSEMEHFSEAYQWARAIYSNGVGRVCLVIGQGKDQSYVEITSDSDWALAVLTYPHDYT